MTGNCAGEGRAKAQRRRSGSAGDPERQLPDHGKPFVSAPRCDVHVLSHAGFTLLTSVAHANQRKSGATALVR
jgi:hypothetical protein